MVNYGDVVIQNIYDTFNSTSVIANDETLNAGPNMARISKIHLNSCVLTNFRELLSVTNFVTIVEKDKKIVI